MITSVYDRQNHRLTVEGHDEKENDTESRARLCTAVTTLVYTLAAALLDLTAAGQITSPDASLRPGRALLACHSSHASRGVVLLTFDTIARGLALLASRYPEMVRYEEM
jgi:uncharacterized protein YsxB (DUF464 family)